MSERKAAFSSNGSRFVALRWLQLLRPANASTAVQYITVFVVTVMVALVAVGASRQTVIPNLSLVFVIPVVSAAVVYGLGPSLFSVVLAALAYNFFVVEPHDNRVVEDAANLWTIALLFVVGCIVSAVASTARRRADEVSRLRRQDAVLQACSRDIVATEDPREIASIAADALDVLFQVPVVVGIVSGEAAYYVQRGYKIELTGLEMEAAQSALLTQQFVPAGVYPFYASRFDFWPVLTWVAPETVIGLAIDPQERPLEPERLVDVVASLLGLALDRQHSHSL